MSKRLKVWAFGVMCWLLAMAGQAQVPPPDTTNPAETFRVRVENIDFGRVDVSVDGGKTYRLLGRVTRPATRPQTDKSAKSVGRVLRTSDVGVTFSIGLDQTLTLNALSPTRKPTASAIQTNIPSKQSLFKELTIPRHTEARLQSAPGVLEPLQSLFSLGDSDTFVFLVYLSEDSPERRTALRERADKLAETYQKEALERAKSDSKRIVSGILTLRPKLPPNEPEPIVYITYAVDGDSIAAQNTEPYFHEWDTKTVPDGEYVIEIRALNKQGALLTKARTLIYVRNHANSAGIKGI